MTDPEQAESLRCCGCGDTFPETAGPTHPYMASSPGCWAAYGVVLAREYQDRAYAPFHRLTVDVYAVQHPGVAGPQARNSVGIHLSRLFLIIERGWSIEKANDAMLMITAKKKDYPWLEPPAQRGSITVKHLLAASTPEEHLARVDEWAGDVWKSWSEHHDTVRGWLNRE